MPFTISHAQLSDAPEMAQVNVTARRETYKDILSPAALNHMTVEKKTERFMATIQAADPLNAYLVARDEKGEIVGLATGGVWEEKTVPVEMSQPLGQVFALYILDKVKGQDLGAQLFRTLWRELAARGFTSFALSVLEENHRARRFYEKMGGTLSCPHTITIADEPYRGLIYVWPDIKVLA